MVRTLAERGFRLAIVADGAAQSFKNLLTQKLLYDYFEDVDLFGADEGLDNRIPGCLRRRWAPWISASGTAPDHHGRQQPGPRR